MTTKNKSSRKIRAEKLYLELVERGIARKSEKRAVKLLTASCLRAYQDTRSTPKQKERYKHVEFQFDNPLDMASYFITELPEEWGRWKAQTKVYYSAKGNSAKTKTRPTVDRIIEVLHYERDNLQMLPHADNARKAKQKTLVYIDFATGSYETSESSKGMKIGLKVNDKIFKMLKQSGNILLLKQLKFKNEAQRRKYNEVVGAWHRNVSDKVLTDDFFLNQTAEQRLETRKAIFVEILKEQRSRS